MVFFIKHINPHAQPRERYTAPFQYLTHLKALTLRFLNTTPDKKKFISYF